MFFTNGTMKCKQCGATQKADPNIESGWTIALIEGKPSYYCPQCFNGGSGANKCSKCDRWYNWTYSKCPFCKVSKGFSK